MWGMYSLFSMALLHAASAYGQLYLCLIQQCLRLRIPMSQKIRNGTKSLGNIQDVHSLDLKVQNFNLTGPLQNVNTRHCDFCATWIHFCNNVQ
jgi:hypothetical protein